MPSVLIENAIERGNRHPDSAPGASVIACTPKALEQVTDQPDGFGHTTMQHKEYCEFARAMLVVQVDSTLSASVAARCR